ncbi:hypothetical protein ACNHE5_17910 [Pandoraea pnomenusa]|uniref:hypothetical protein n=1 Tax=Pandoraea pnomenusa TaxID=93220 RepID=UPI003CF726EF
MMKISALLRAFGAPARSGLMASVAAGAVAVVTPLSAQAALPIQSWIARRGRR